MPADVLAAVIPDTATTGPVWRLLFWLVGCCVLVVFAALVRSAYQMVLARNSTEGAEVTRSLLYTFAGLLTILSAAEIIIGVLAFS